MINDYIENSLAWVYYNHKMFGNEKLMIYDFPWGKIFYIMEFKRKGIKITDITIHYSLEISHSHIVDLNPIEIFLDN